MDVIFKIAGWMILIILSLVALLVLINVWPDIAISLSNFFFDSSEDNEEDDAEVECFKAQVSDILRIMGHYDSEQRIRIYSDSKITIYEDKRITWKSKSENPREDCLNYVEELHDSCMEQEAFSRKVRENLARIREEEKAEKAAEQKAYRVRIGELETAANFIVQKLGDCTEKGFHNSYHYERDDIIINWSTEERPRIYYNGICVFYMHYDQYSDSISSTCEIYRPDDEWENELLHMYESAKLEVKRLDKAERLRKQEEWRINHSPLKS